MAERGEQQSRDRLVPVRAPLSERSPSNPATQKQYAYFYPFLLPAVFPGLAVDPITECYSQISLPSEYFYTVFDEEIIDLGPRGKELGLPGNVLMYIPQNEIAQVLNFLRSIAFYNDQGSALTLRIQELTIRDPSLKGQFSFDYYKELIQVHAIVLESGSGAIYLQPQHVGGIPVSYRAVHSSRIKDPRLPKFVSSFLSSETDPFGKVEEEYGPYEFKDDKIREDSDQN